MLKDAVKVAFRDKRRKPLNPTAPRVARRSHQCELCFCSIEIGELYCGGQYRKAHMHCAQRTIKGDHDAMDWLDLEIFDNGAMGVRCPLCMMPIHRNERHVRNGEQDAHLACVTKLMIEKCMSDPKRPSDAFAALYRRHEEIGDDYADLKQAMRKICQVTEVMIEAASRCADTEEKQTQCRLALEELELARGVLDRGM